jgi:hypothetical protein
MMDNVFAVYSNGYAIPDSRKHEHSFMFQAKKILVSGQRCLLFTSASNTKFRQGKPPLFFVWPRRGNPRLASLNKGFPNESQAEKSKAWSC